jgi:DNA-binding MarR family transcriptional regulator
MGKPAELPLDAETKALEAPHDHKNDLRLWLRLLTCSTMVETEIRRRLRERFDVTLPRFDLMAQLERAPQGMTLGEVSKRMMVSNGNVTGLVDRLVESGHIVRSSPREDRRVQRITLTAEGREAFSRMAQAHEDWIAEMLADLGESDVTSLLTRLAKLKVSVQKALDRRGS